MLLGRRGSIRPLNPIRATYGSETAHASTPGSSQACASDESRCDRRPSPDQDRARSHHRDEEDPWPLWLCAAAVYPRRCPRATHRGDARQAHPGLRKRWSARRAHPALHGHGRHARARIGADDGRRPDGGPLPMTLAWTFLAQWGYRPVQPGEAPTGAATTWCLRALYLQQYGSAVLE